MYRRVAAIQFPKKYAPAFFWLLGAREEKAKERDSPQEGRAVAAASLLLATAGAAGGGGVTYRTGSIFGATSSPYPTDDSGLPIASSCLRRWR